MVNFKLSWARISRAITLAPQWAYEKMGGTPKSAFAFSALAVGYIYLFLPSLNILSPVYGLYIFPGDGYESQAVWHLYHGIFYSGLTSRRSLLQMSLGEAADFLNIPPWDIWQFVTVVLAIVSTYLTYRFLKHFLKATPFEFLVCSFAVPYSVLTLQFASDSNIAYALLIGSMLTAIRGGGWLVLSGLLAVIGIWMRADMLPILGITPLIIWVDRQNMSDRIRDIVIFGLGVTVFGGWLLYVHNETPWGYVGYILKSGLSYVNTDWRMDALMKIFTFASVLLFPFYVAKTYQDIKRKGAVATLWPLVPIAIYLFIFFNRINLPRYMLYSAPFILYLVLDTGRYAIGVLKSLPVLRLPFVVPVLIAAFLFNPYFHIVNRNANTDNFIAWVSENYSEKIMYSYIHTGVLPYLNYAFRRQSSYCFGYLYGLFYDFFSGPQKYMAFFTGGGTGENTAAHYVYRSYFDVNDVPHGKRSYGKNLPLKSVTKNYADPKVDISGHDVVHFWDEKKHLFLIKMRGGFIPRGNFLREGWVLNSYLDEAKIPVAGGGILREGLFDKIISFNFRSGNYPEYLDKSNHCWIRDPYTVRVLSTGFPDTPLKKFREYTYVAPVIMDSVDVPGSPRLEAPMVVLPETAPPAPVQAAESKALVVTTATEGETKAQAVSEPPGEAADGPDSIFRRRFSERTEWLKSIPDYEERLYNRVKRINKRTVEIERLVVFGIVISLLIGPILAVIIMKWLSRNLFVLGSAALASKDAKRKAPAKADDGGTAGRFMRDLRQIEVNLRLAAIGRNQRRLKNMLDLIDFRIKEGLEHPDDLEELVQRIRTELDELAEKSEAVDASLKKTS